MTNNSRMEPRPMPPERPRPSDEQLRALAEIAGVANIVAPQDSGPFLTEWRSRWPGSAALIATPDSVERISAIVRYCADQNISITPQGGNTGLVGGQIPFGPEILLSLKKLRRIRDISPLNNTMTVDAGLTLAEAQSAAKDAERLFPLSIGSEGSCQIGGVISTNAGGVNVLRYGNMRDLVLGIEAVLPNGEVWNGLKRLRKNNTGYDLKQLFIGGEGTLGIVTGAVLKLFPAPRDLATAFVGLPSVEAAVELLAHAQGESGGATTSFELMSRRCVDFVLKHIPNTRDPMSETHPWYVLMEFSSSAPETMHAKMEKTLAGAIDKGLVADAAIAQNETQAKAFWRIRHSISEAINGEGLGARHDVSVATNDIPAFLRDAETTVMKIAPAARIVAFGHMGDGNVHYDVAPPEGADKSALDPLREDIESAVYDVIEKYDGSISAEHGIGRHRRATLAKRKSAIELEMMRAIKTALDPKGIMNPGKML